MALSQSVRFQFRLIFCHVGGVAAESVMMPYILAAGIQMRHVVLAWVLGTMLFLTLAIAGGLVWRSSIIAQPIRWGLGAPVALALTIYLLLRSFSDFESGDARIAMEAGLVGGVCALFSSGCFIVGTCVAPAGPSGEHGQGRTNQT